MSSADSRSKSRCIYTITDNNYVGHLAAMIASLADHHREYPVFVLHTDLTESSLAGLRNLAERTGVRVEPVRNDGIDLSAYEHCGHWPQCVWLKFHIGDLLPAGCERALFIDNDMIVMRPLDALFETDMGGQPAAAVIDMQDVSESFKAGLGIEKSARYFNTGLMLVDMRRWRETRFGERAAAFARANPERISFIDQCAFNAAGWREFHELDATWNAMVAYVECGDAMPHIVHYCALKPWEAGKTPGRELYLHYRNRTPFPMDRPAIPGLPERLRGWWDGLEDRAAELAGLSQRGDRHAMRRRNRIRLRRWYRDLAGA